MRAFRLETNWAGNYEYQSGELQRPSTVEQLQEIVASATSVHVLGSRHSFNGIADSAELITLRDLPSDLTVDHAQGTVGFGAGLTYGELAVALRAEGLGSAQPRLAAAHLRRRCRHDRNTRLGR